MKTVIGLLKAIALVIFIWPLMAESCSDAGNVGYYHVNIPDYKNADYYQMLFTRNEELQYNAICNLWAISDRDALEVDSLKGSSRHKMAQKIYDKIYSMMDAENTWISSAAIRYIGRFEYNQPALIQYVLSNFNPSVNVQLAVWNVWKNIEDKALGDSSQLVKKANFCLQHPSWLIKQCAYDYITSATAPYYENALMKTYDTCAEQYQKLEIVAVLNLHLCGMVFDFLTRHYTGNPDSVVKKQILFSLANARNTQQALNWFQQHQKETAIVLENGFQFSDQRADFYRGLVQVALRQGWDPAEKEYFTEDNQHYPLLYYILLEDKYHFENSDSIKQPQSQGCKKIELQLLADKKLRPAWLLYESTHLRFSLPDQLVKAHRQLTDEYVAAINKLFDHYKTDSSYAKNFFVQLQNASKSLYSSKYLKK
jgi:hypothetical protein